MHNTLFKQKAEGLQHLPLIICLNVKLTIIEHMLSLL